MGAGTPQPPTSPWVYQATDYAGSLIRITITFDNTTLALTGCTVYRDAACVYTKILLGIGPDGTPDTTPYAFAVPAGTTTISAAQMSKHGLNTYTDVNSMQVTAGF